MALKEVCRLCLTTEELVWVFDKRFETNNSMKDVVYITTGVEITYKDIISQKICKKCCQVTIKMFEFRRTSLKNDQHLKDQCKLILRQKELKIPNTQVTIRSDTKNSVLEKKIDTNKVASEPKQDPKPKIASEPKQDPKLKIAPEPKQDPKPKVASEPKQDPKLKIAPEPKQDPKPKVASESKKDPKPKAAFEPKQDPKPSLKIHTSVRELFEVYPQIKIPTSCLKYNISPSVTMKMDLVERYFKSRKIDIHKHTKLAMRAGKVATKRTYPSKTKNVTSPKVNAIPKAVKSARVKPLKVEEVNPSPVTDRTISRTSDVNVDAITCDDKIPVKDAAPQLLPPSNKRKHPEGVPDVPEKKEFKKANFIESLGLTPKPDAETPAGGPSFITNKTQPVHICEICNSVQYSSKELRKHKNKHLKCQFCKLKFRTLEGKKEHLDKSCPIKNMMNKFPKVELERVDYNEWVRSRYPEAFQEFPNLNTPINNNEDIHSEEEKVPKPVEQLQEPCEVIEILSDEEDDARLSTSKDNVQTEGQVLPSVQKTEMMVDYNLYNTVSIVRPDIKIKGSNALDVIDARLTDIKVLKELLTLYKPVQIYTDRGVQTAVPVNDTISINSVDMTAELKLLKPQLHVFKIPVVMKTGSFGVCYNYVSEQKPPKKLCLWNDLTAIDVKFTAIKVVPRQNSTTTSITIYNSSPNLANRSQQSLTPSTSKFIRVNANSLSPITTGLYTPPSSSLIDTNPMLNSFLQKVTSATTPVVTIAHTTTVATIAQAAAPVVTIPQTTMATLTSTTVATTPTVVATEASKVETSGPQFGIIRVKNVWELT